MTPEVNVPLQACNSFGIVAKARRLVRVRSAAEVQQSLAGGAPGEGWFVLGGGSNIVLTGDVKPTVLKVEISGRCVVAETERHWVVEAGAGENWHDFVTWTLDQGMPGLENLALIPGTSRSGATILGGMAFGLSRTVATEFSFLLAVPMMVAASGYQAIRHRDLFTTADAPYVAIAFAMSFLAGLVAVRWLLRYIAAHDYRPFAWYRIGLAVAILAYF